MWGWWTGGPLGAGGSLRWATPEAVIVVAAVLALAAWLLAWRGQRGVVAQVVELVAWALALVGLVVAVARPVWVEEEGRTEGGRLVALVDGSSSMSVVEGDTPRTARADEVVAELAAQGAEIFHFGGGLAPGAPVAYDLPDTDLEAALHALGDRFAGERLAGLVVVSDGIDRGLLRRRFQREDDPAPPRLPGPLTVVQVGQADDLQDLAVATVDAGGYAYVHTPFRIRATLRGLGFEGQTVQTDLLQDGAIVRSQSVVLDDEGNGEAIFEVRPDRAGRFSYLVQVPDYEADAVLANNALPVVVRVVRDRIRVLQVAGAPSWDVKFLRRFLKGDPSVDLVSFFILRTSDDVDDRWQDHELSLITFPYPQLFSEDLRTFDLVVFQNFDHQPYFGGASSELLGNLRDFVVRDGHAIAMLGGDRSFSLGRYGGTALGDILPVSPAPQPVRPDEAPFSPVLTEAGRRHPITRLVGDPFENQAWWGRLHALDGTNTGIVARPDAAVLLQHPSVRTSTGAPLPVLSVREVGEGRTMAMSVDTSWRWSLSEAAEGRGNQAYLRFWKAAMRWLVADPTTARLTVDTTRENYGLDDEVKIVVSARDADFAPLVGGQVEVVVKSATGVESFEAETGPDGEVAVVFQPTRRGAHRVEVAVREGAVEIDTAQTVFAVTSRDPELDDVAPDPAFLQWLAERTGGRFVAPGEDVVPLIDDDAGRTVWDRHEVALWRSPLLAAWIALFAGLAWWVRRRAGLR